MNIMEYNRYPLISQEYRKGVTIIVPAYNEEKRITSVLKDVTSLISSNHLDWNILIAIDGDDGTADLVLKFKESFPNIIYKVNKQRHGKGYAIKQAIIRDSDQLGNTVIIMDADNSMNFREIISNINEMDKTDILIFNRYGKCNNIPLRRRFLGRTFNIMVKGILRLRIDDTQSGYKIFRKNVLIKDINKTSINGAFFDVSLLYHATRDGYSIKEIKSKTYRHNIGSTFNTAGLTFAMFISIFALKFRYSKIYKVLPDKIIQRMLNIYQKHIKL